MQNRTKKMFVEAILFLSKQKPLNDITVTDLINYCHVNRYTFYYHFKDKYDLILYVLISTALEIFSTVEDDGKIINKQQLMLLLTHFKENKRFYKSAFSDFSPYSLTKAWYEFNVGLYRTMACKALNVETLSKDVDNAIRFAFGGNYRLLLDWIQNDCQEDIEQMVYYSNLYFTMIYNQFVGNVSITEHFDDYVEEQRSTQK